MGQVYILRLVGGKWYVGYTEKNIVRVLKHAEKKGAKWTKKHPPMKNNFLYEMTSPDHSIEDEDRITLALMDQHGIQNVRGGSWCMVKMYPNTVKELQAEIDKLTPMVKSKGEKCSRCGRGSHNRTRCYAVSTVDGVKITTKSWTYWPKKGDDTIRKAKPKKKSVTCGKCGRLGHNRKTCSSKLTVDGVRITTESWVYRKKSKSNRAAKAAKKLERVLRKGSKKQSQEEYEFELWADNANIAAGARGFFGGKIPSWAKKQNKK
jgi:predicted GIY-YIG superfamily endonuclease/ribosomal protein S27AE